MTSVHKVNSHRCLICPDASFPTHYHLKRHREEFHDGFKEAKTEWPCDFPGCKYVGKSRQVLWCHKKTHTTEKPWKCDQCDYACKIKNQLILHQEMVISNLS